ncbi:MAG: Uma2 family endonuclease [Polyangiaceae bacterium]
MAQAPHARFTFAEYIRLEANSPIKHEFSEGQVYAMAGGTPEHAALAGRIATTLGTALRDGPCDLFTSDLRVRVAASGLTTYPDLTVVCQPWHRDPEDRNTVTNPRLLVEVLSTSTAAYDRGEKLSHYQRIPSLKEVLLVAHEVRRLELWRRGPDDRWQLVVRESGQQLDVESVGATLDVDSIYRDLVDGPA